MVYSIVSGDWPWVCSIVIYQKTPLEQIRQLVVGYHALSINHTHVFFNLRPAAQSNRVF